ncbi:MAG: heme exporter protein CcmD [Alphaproteobacteria bacterium]|nr:heme exporter protein CcmD [Alphaproteobacteria bacterium]
MTGLSSWIAMGGHAPFVWGSYGVSALILGALAIVSWRGHRAARALVARLEAEGARRRPAPGANAAASTAAPERAA